MHCPCMDPSQKSSRSSIRLLAALFVLLLVGATPSLSNAIVREIPSRKAQQRSKARYTAFTLEQSQRKSGRIGGRCRFLSKPTVSFGQSAISLDGVDRGDESSLPLHFIDVRGGGSVSAVDHSAPSYTSLVEETQQRQRRRKAVLVWGTISTVVGLVAYRERAAWTPFMNKDIIQAKTLSILGALQPAENAGPYAVLRALSAYALGMAVWEMAGLSTIPVETAAGMVFGFPQAAAASFCGKLMGATLAFVAGRTILATRIANHKAFASNAVFQLLSHKHDVDGQAIAARHPPLMTAFFMKFSCFPELVKNLGSSLIPVIQPWMFMLATALHGGFFTIIWTWLGVDSAARMQQTALPVNRPLQAALVAAMIIGGVLTPMIMAWWMHDLKRGASETEAFKQGRRVRLDAILSTTTQNHAESSEAAPWPRLKHRLVKSQLWIAGLVGTAFLGSGGSL